MGAGGRNGQWIGILRHNISTAQRRRLSPIQLKGRYIDRKEETGMGRVGKKNQMMLFFNFVVDI